MAEKMKSAEAAAPLIDNGDVKKLTFPKRSERIFAVSPTT